MSTVAPIQSQPSIAPARWIKANLLPSVFGFTAEAARKRRERGEWLEGVHFKQIGRIYMYCVPAIEDWIENQ